MMIEKYDKYKKIQNHFVLINERSLSNFFNLTIFLLSYFGYVKRDGILHFLEKNKLGIMFEEINIDIDNQDNLVYINESYCSSIDKPTTPEIEALLEKEDFIQLCKIGFLDHIVMTKENFRHLLLAWDKIVDQLPPFALLYLDDQNWYDVLPFDSQEAMENFVADHTKIENSK